MKYFTYVSSNLFLFKITQSVFFTYRFIGPLDSARLQEPFLFYPKSYVFRSSFLILLKLISKLFRNRLTIFLFFLLLIPLFLINSVSIAKSPLIRVISISILYFHAGCVLPCFPYPYNSIPLFFVTNATVAYINSFTCVITSGCLLFFYF